MKWSVYKTEFIIEVVECSINHSVAYSSKKYNIPVQTIYRWKNNPDNIDKLISKRKTYSDEAKKILQRKYIKYNTFGAAKYTTTQRKEILEYYKKYGRKNTMDKFGVSESSIYTWRDKQKAGMLNKAKKVKRSVKTINNKAIKNLNKKDLIVKAEYLLSGYEFQIIPTMTKRTRFLAIKGTKKRYPNISIWSLCAFMKVSKSGYYKWLKSGNYTSYNLKPDLEKSLLKIREEYSDTYGLKRIKRILEKKYNLDYTIHTINKHLKYLGLETKVYKNKKTQDWKHLKDFDGHLKNLLFDKKTKKAKLKSNKYNQIWCSDITFIKKPGSHDRHNSIKLIAIIELKTRYILGYKLINKEHSGDEFRKLYLKTIKTHGSPDIFHSDRGPEFASKKTLKISNKYNIKQSFSRAYTPTDNSVIERFFGTTKMENNYFKNYTTNSEKYNAVSRWIHFYNNERYHSTIDASPGELKKFLIKKDKLSKNFKELKQNTISNLEQIKIVK